MMFSWPSPWPIDFATGSLGGFDPLLFPPLVLPPLFALLPPAAMPTMAAAHKPFVLMLPPGLGDPPRSRRSVRDATRHAPSGRDPRARPQTWFRGSDGRPEALHLRRAPRRSG